MNTSLRRITILQFLLIGFSAFLSGFGLIREVECLGINYGQIGNNLPEPQKALQLLEALRITKTRIYDTNPEILTAFANSNVELIVTVPNQMLSTLAGDPQSATQWVTTNIKPYFPAAKIAGISVGNEIITDDDTSLMGYLVPAMVNIHAALVKLGFDRYIQVSSPHSLAVLANSFPPSSGYFKPEITGVMQQFLQFLAATKSPFWINAYPYFAYKDSPTKISLDYVLFNPNSGMVDPYTKLHYDNMLYAQVDAVAFAIERMGFTGVEVRVSETGWPSRGDADEVGASLQNAAIYNRNLMRRQLLNEGTPLRPNTRLEIYVFALFNEDEKPGPTSERNYGLFQPDGTMTYNVGLLSSTSATSSTSPSSASVSFTSSATTKVEHMGYLSFMFWMFVHLLAWQVMIRRQD